MVENTKFVIIDSIMGSGKTEAMLDNIVRNQLGADKYVIVVPYISEIERYMTAFRANGINFSQPDNKSANGKHGNFKEMLDKGYNIVTSHSIFQDFDLEAIELIRQHNYTLIIDEVPEVVQVFNYDVTKIHDLKQLGRISIDENTGIVRWIGGDVGGFGTELRSMCDSGRLVYNEKSNCLFLLYPFNTFDAFKRVYIMTYMFEGQTIYYYFKYYRFEYIKWIPFPDSDEKIDGKYKSYSFYPNNDKINYIDKGHFKDRIHICDNKYINTIGDKRTALSSSWYIGARRDPKKLDQLKKNMINFFRRIQESPSSNNLWTTFKNFEDALKGPGFAKNCFVPVNARGINTYSDRHCMAYMVNRFMNPYVKHFFSDAGIEVDEDKFALAEMLQVIWRSAIRNDEEIWLYIPSKRMRTLLELWIEEHSYTEWDLSPDSLWDDEEEAKQKQKTERKQKKSRKRGWHIDD